ncbi:unnamed protein product [Dicrocoelium dendriticum]|nr:unnamed protein product [Dicrocoelium dendriticum]
MGEGTTVNCQSASPSNNEATSSEALDLLMEFLNCVMAKDFRQAYTVGQKVLEIEPENKEVKAFLPLISEALKIKLSGIFHQDVDSENDNENLEEEETAEEEEEESTSNSSSSSSESDSSSSSDLGDRTAKA